MKKFLKILILALLLFLLFFWLGLQWQSPSEARAEIKGQIFDLVIASDPGQWSIGLSGRPALAPDQAMLFVFPDYQVRSFWMKDMNFAIDILWLADNQVVGFAKNIQPPAQGTNEDDLERYVSPVPVNLVLEVVAGTIDRLNIEKGDIINLKGLDYRMIK
ncbi:MAG: DUF192 domain-containing protein [Patescibacteria group bacterium]|nr:DUF192 domain-containing protein [Patescibacteria group bacterium]